jgi:hypothetical protein
VVNGSTQSLLIEGNTEDGVEPATDEVSRIVVEDPDAVEHDFARLPDQTSVAFGDTSQAGVYYVSQYAGDDIAAQEAFTVNLFARDETVTPPNALPGLPAGQVVSAAEPTTERRELWPWVATVGFLLLMGEWLYSQRIVVRRALLERRARKAIRPD